MFYESGIEKGGGSKTQGKVLLPTGGDTDTLSQRVVGGCRYKEQGACL